MQEKNGRSEGVKVENTTFFSKNYRDPEANLSA